MYRSLITEIKELTDEVFKTTFWFMNKAIINLARLFELQKSERSQN